MPGKNTFPGLFQIFLLLLSCNSGRHAIENPPAPGFNISGSDTKAIKIADEVMAAMGGRKAWDDTRFISWTFFGNRKHNWDKRTGDVRIESKKDSTIYLLNVNTMKGQVRRRGVVETHPDTLEMLLQRGKSLWINDMYWLLMPFKLKDSGVTLKYVGEGKTDAAKPAHVLQLTFENVGDTPENKYHVWVDKQNRLVTQWAFFRSATNEKPDFTNPWEDYRQYGGILISGGRGKRSLTDISVVENLPKETFTSFD